MLQRLLDEFLNWTPRRRAPRTSWMPTTSMEDLESRQLPSCINIGDYTGTDPEAGQVTLHVNGPNEDGDQFAFLTGDGFNIRLRVECKKHETVLKVASTPGGPKGKLIAHQGPNLGVINYESHLKGKNSPDLGDGALSPDN